MWAKYPEGSPLPLSFFLCLQFTVLFACSSPLRLLLAVVLPVTLVPQRPYSPRCQQSAFLGRRQPPKSTLSPLPDSLSSECVFLTRSFSGLLQPMGQGYGCPAYGTRRNKRTNLNSQGLRMVSYTHPKNFCFPLFRNQYIHGTHTPTSSWTHTMPKHIDIVHRTLLNS